LAEAVGGAVLAQAITTAQKVCRGEFKALGLTTKKELLANSLLFEILQSQ